MKRIFLPAIIALLSLVIACDNSPRFTIEGCITDADSLTLYLENITGNNPVTIDSVVLDKKGNYKFTHPVAQHAQFYRLRMGQHNINLVIDSVSHILCSGDAARLSTHYTIEGNDDCTIMREVTLSSGRLKNVVNDAMNNSDSRLAALDSIAAYKERMTTLVLQSPASAVSYYILMQRVNGLPIFDTFDYNDNRIIAASATSHEIYAPDAPRTEVLRIVALQGIAARRQEQQQAVEVEADEINFVDIALYDIAGKERKLSDVTAANKVVLLDFTAYSLEYSPAYNITLAEIYNQYRKRGLEIYQVAFDTDINRWQTVADNLPWCCVHDADNVYSTLVALYDLQSLPSCYIIVNNGEQLLRPQDVEELKENLKQIMGR